MLDDYRVAKPEAGPTDAMSSLLHKRKFFLRNQEFRWIFRNYDVTFETDGYVPFQIEIQDILWMRRNNDKAI